MGMKLVPRSYRFYETRHKSPFSNRIAL